MTKFQALFEASIVDALRRGRRADEVAMMSHHDMVILKATCYAKYLRGTASPALTTDDVERFVAALDLPLLHERFGVANLYLPGVDIEPVGMATLRRHTSQHRTFPCATVQLPNDNTKDVNDRGAWRPKPARAPTAAAANLLAACARSIDAYAALHGVTIKEFDVKKYGVYSLFGAGAQPTCMDVALIDGARTWATVYTLPYAQMTTRQLNGLTVGLMTKEELIDALPSDLFARANANETRALLDAPDLESASVHRLRMFVLRRSSRPIPMSEVLLARRKTLMGKNSAVVADGFVVSTPTPDGTGIVSVCGTANAARALLTTAMIHATGDVITAGPDVPQILLTSFGFGPGRSVRRDMVTPDNIARWLPLN
jgi:hypothetical protein